MDHDELESAAAAMVGKIVFAFSRLEFNLGLCLRSAVGGDVNGVNFLVDRLNFKSKLDALLDVVEYRFSAHEKCVSDFRAWHRDIDSLRVKRNSFIHGRWGVHAHSGEVINVAPGMPSSTPQRESRLTLNELEASLVELDGVAAAFSLWRTKWGV